MFYPDVAVRPGFPNLIYLDKETFTDLPQGVRREADVMAQVASRDNTAELIVINIEMESQRRDNFPRRLFQYYYLLQSR